MWERRAFLASFVGLCAAQREAMAVLRARQASPPLGGGGQFEDTHLPSIPAFDVLLPREPQITPAMSNDRPDVFTTVLYPSVPTAAPTANLVPIFVTYTGTLAASEVPEGFQWTAPAPEPGTFAPTASQDVPTVVNRPNTPTILAAIVPVPTDTTMSTSTFSTTLMPASTPTVSMPTSSMTSDSFSMASSTISSTTSLTSSRLSTSSSSTTSSFSTTSISTTASNTLSVVLTGTGLSNKNGAQETHRLSSRSIAGVVVGVVGGAILFILLALFLWSRNKRSKRPSSPGVYPEEAYLYDPPITPPPELMSGGNGGDIGRALSPERPGAEREGLMTGALVLGAAAVGRGRAGSDARPAQQWNGYSPIESRDMAERNFTTPASNPFTDPRFELGAVAVSGSHWPLNPNADSGLGTPPATASGLPSIRPVTRPSMERPSTSRSQAAGSGTPPTVAGPSISGVGSSRYERRLSGPGSPPPISTGEIIPSPHMRELRKAWGMDQ